MRRRMLVVCVCVGVFAATGCATQAPFVRVGRPADFMTADRTAIPVYTVPNISVNVNTVKENSWVTWLPGGSNMATTAAYLANNEILQRFLTAGLGEHAQQGVARLFSEALADINRLRAASMVVFRGSISETAFQKSQVDASREMLSVETFIGFTAARGGIVPMVDLTVAYLSSGTPRRTIWADKFTCELAPIKPNDNLVADQSARAKQLVTQALERLRPFVERELRGEAYDTFPRVQVNYGGSRTEEGWLIENGEQGMAIRLVGGRTRVIPKSFVQTMTVVKPGAPPRSE